MLRSSGMGNPNPPFRQTNYFSAPLLSDKISLSLMHPRSEMGKGFKKKLVLPAGGGGTTPLDPRIEMAILGKVVFFPLVHVKRQFRAKSEKLLLLFINMEN